MAAPRGSVAIAGVALVADVGLYEPFTPWPLSVTVFDGIDASTIQDFGRRIVRASGRLTSGSNESPGLVPRATLDALLTIMATRGASQALTDNLGNAGTVKLLTFDWQHQAGVPGAQVALFSYALTWRWLTLTTLFGTAYTGD